ncbi:MAG TPA: hypothetical protein VE130_02420 [Nitrososphaeraceae archaeon]|nr:hypothetical protein [Nitrososphaeraceae archaeon]
MPVLQSFLGCLTQKYFSYRPNEEITFAGKDSEGKTVYKNRDGSPHQHREKLQQQSQQQTQQQLQPQQQDEPFEKVSDESADRGITAFTMMSDLIGLAEQNQKQLVTINEKIDHLTKLVYASSKQ